MKYIKSREHIFSKKQNLTESFLNPEGGKDIEVEWEDTLVGSLLNRIYGGSKNKLKNTTINRLGKKLDAAIAKMFIVKASENNADAKEVIENAESEVVYMDVDNIIQDIELIIKPDSQLKLDDTKKQNLLDGIDTILLSPVIEKDEEVKGFLEESKKFLLAQHTDDDGNDTRLSDEELDSIEKGTRLLVKTEDNKNIEVVVESDGIDEEKKTLEVIDSEKNKLTITSDKIVKIITKEDEESLPSKLPANEEELNELKKRAKNLDTFFDKLISFMKSHAKSDKQEEVIEKLTEFKNNQLPEVLKVSSIEKEKFDELMNKIEYLEKTWVRVQSEMTNKNEDENDEQAEVVSERYNFIFEDSSSDKTIDITKTKLSSNIDKVKDIVKERKASYKVTKQDIEKIDDAVKTSSKDIVNGSDLREIVNTMQKAKNAILKNDFTGIPKKQKKYYIDISNNMALHKSTYDAWEKRVTNIVSYYKDLLPDDLKKFLLDALDYDSFKNFQKVVKEYLNLDIKDTTKSKSDSDKPSIEEVGQKLRENKSKDNTFVKVDGFVPKTLMPFMMKAKKGYIVALPIFVDLEKTKIVIAKYKSNNTAWLKSYAGSGAIIRDNITDVNNNADDEPVKIVAFKLSDNNRIAVGQKLKLVKIPLDYNFESNQLDLIKKDDDYKISTLSALYDTSVTKLANFKSADNQAKVFDINDVNQTKFQLNGDAKLKPNSKTFTKNALQLILRELQNMDKSEKSDEL